MLRKHQEYSHSDPRDKHGFPILDPLISNAALAALFEPQEPNPMVLYVDPCAWGKTIDALEQEFITLRDKMARTSRTRYLKGNSERSFTDADVEEFVRETATQDNDRAWYRSAIPNNRFFRENMLPTLVTLAQTPEDLAVVTKTAFEALRRLLVWDFSGSSCGRTPGYIPKIFFNQEDPGENYGRGGNQGSGQFAYFYKKYGPEYALAVASLQGWLADEHYEGGHSYCISAGEIERKLSGLWENCPPQLRNRCLQIYANICAKNHYCGDAFAHEFPRVLKRFADEGKPHLLETLLDIASLDLNVNIGQSSLRDAAHTSHINIFSPENMIEECRALSAHAYKPELLSYAQSIAHHSSGGYRDNDISFIKGAKKETLADQVEKLEKAGYQPDDIRAILSLEATYPWLGESAHLIIEEWVNIENKFPGGVAGLIPYCAKLQPNRHCIKSCVLAVRFAKKVPSVDSPYWSLGIALSGKLDSAAVGFFEKDAMETIADKKDPEWQKNVIAAAELAISFPEGPSHDKSGQKKIFAWALPKETNRFGQRIPKQKLEKALVILKTEWLAYAEAHKEQAGWKLRTYYEQLLETFETVYRINKDWQKKFPDRAKEPGVLPTIEDVAHHAAFMTLEIGDSYGTLTHEYGNNIHNGSSPYVAMLMITFGKHVQNLDGANLQKLAMSESMRPKVEVYRQLFDEMQVIRGRLAAVYRMRGDDDVEWRQGQLARLPREKALAMMHLPDSGKALRADLATVKKLKENPDTKDLRTDIDKLEGELRTAINMSSMRDVVRFAVHTGEFHLDQSEFFRVTNDSTRLAISGTALLMALGGNGVKMDKGALELLPDFRDENGSLSMVERITEKRGGKFLDALIRNMKTALPFVERHVREHRELAVGMMPIGAKIHTPHAMSGEMLKILQMVFGLSTSPFHLIHAGETLLLDPLPTPTELKMLVNLLEVFGSVDPSVRQLQTTMGGRLSREQAPIVGSSILLGTRTGISYAPGAFQTTHEQTGARFMAYDAGVKKAGLPFDIQNAEGRTDVLGRRALEDLDLHHVIGTLVTHEQFGGQFAHLAPGFKAKLKYILQKHGLDEAIHESAWVFDHAQPHDSLASHEAMIRHFTDTWMSATRQIDYGVIREMGEIVSETVHQMRDDQERIKRVQPEDYARIKRY